MAGELSLPTMVQKYRLDASGAKAGASQVQGASKQAVDSLGGIKTAVHGAVQGFLAFKGVQFLKGVVEEAAQTQQAIKTTTTLFGDSGHEIVEWSETTARSLGLSKAATLEMAEGVGTMIKGFGLAAPKAAEMSQELIKVAVDVGAFRDKDPSAVLTSFTRGLGGASRGLKQYGVDVSTAAQTEEALKLGIQGTAKEWTSAQKAAVFYQLILKGTGDATGAFSERSGDLAIQQKILKAEFANVKDEIGQGLLPIVTKLFSVFSAGFDIIGPGGLQMAAQISAIGGSVAALLAGGSALTKIFGSVAEVFDDTNISAAQVVLEADQITTAMGPAAAVSKTAAAANIAVGASAGVAAGGLELETIAATDSAAATTAAGTAAETTAGKFGLMKLSAAGAIPIYAALVTGVYFLGRTLYDLFAVSNNAKLDISASAHTMADSLLKGVTSADTAKTALDGLTDATKKWFLAQGAAAEQTGGTLIKNLGLSYGEVTAIVTQGEPAIRAYVKGLNLSETNAGTLTNGLLNLHGALNDSAEATLKHLKQTEALNPALVDQAVKMSTAKDGTVDWAGALSLVANKQGDVASASGNLVLKLDVERDKWNLLTQAIINNTDRLRDQESGLLGVQNSSISAEQNLFRIADAQKKYTDAQREHGATSREAIEAGLELQQIQNGQVISLNGIVSSTEKWASDTSGLTQAQKDLADAVKGGKPDEIAKANDRVAAKTEVMRAAVQRAADTMHGPGKAALVEWLANTANLVSGVNKHANAIELSIKQSSGLNEALKTQAFIAKSVGKDTDAYAAATADVTKKQGAYRKALLEAAHAASGPVKQAILDYIAVIDRINEKKVTQVAIAGLPVAEQHVATWLIKLGLIKPSKVTTITVKAEEALHKLGLVKDAIDRINQHLGTNVSVSAAVRAEGGRAGGGPVAAGKKYKIGELGPEELELYPGGGGRVTSHAAVESAAQSVAASLTKIPNRVTTDFSVTGLPGATTRILEHSAAVWSIPALRTTDIAAVGTTDAVSAVHTYEAEIAGVPTLVTTEVRTPGVDESAARLATYERTLLDLPSAHETTIAVSGTPAAVLALGAYRAAVEAVPPVQTEVTVVGADVARTQLLGYQGAITDLPDSHDTTVGTAGVAAAIAGLAPYVRALDAVPDEQTTQVTASGVQAAADALAAYRAGLSAVPERRATDITATGVAPAEQRVVSYAHALAGLPDERTTAVTLAGAVAAADRLRTYTVELRALPAVRATDIATSGLTESAARLRAYRVDLLAFPAGASTHVDVSGVDEATLSLRGYRDELGAIPDVATDVSTPGLPDVARHLREYERQVEGLPAGHATTVSLVGLATATDGLRGYRDTLGTIPDQAPTRVALSALNDARAALAVWTTGLRDLPSERATHVFADGIPSAIRGLSEYESILGSIPSDRDTAVTASGLAPAIRGLEVYTATVRAVPSAAGTRVTVEGGAVAETQIRALANIIGRVPGARSTEVTVAGTDLATSQLLSYQGVVRDIPGQRETAVVATGVPDAVTRLLGYVSIARDVPTVLRTDVSASGTATAAVAVLGYTATLGRIPDRADTDVTVSGTEAAAARVHAYGDALTALPLQRATEVHVSAAGIPSAVAALDAYSAEVDRVPTRTATTLELPGVEARARALGAYSEQFSAIPPRAASEVALSGVQEASADLLRFRDIVRAAPAVHATRVELPGIGAAVRELAVYRTGLERLPAVHATKVLTPTIPAVQAPDSAELAVQVATAGRLSAGLIPGEAASGHARPIHVTNEWDIDVEMKDGNPKRAARTLIDEIRHAERHGSVGMQTGLPREVYGG